MIIVLFILLYILVGSSLGGYYYYLRYKEWEDDMEDMSGLPIFMMFAWPVISPLAFIIFFVQKKVDEED